MRYTDHFRRAYLSGRLTQVKDFHRAAFLASRDMVAEELMAKWVEQRRDKSKDKIYNWMGGVLGTMSASMQALAGWIGTQAEAGMSVPPGIAEEVKAALDHSP